MSANELLRWVPDKSLPNLPLSKIGIEYEGCQGELNLICNVRSADGVGAWGETRMRFSNVLSFKLYEEFQEPLQYDAGLPWSEHRILLPYGGIWPYFEIKGSDWLRRLADRDSRELALRHLVIVSQNEALHVATCMDSEITTETSQETVA